MLRVYINRIVRYSCQFLFFVIHYGYVISYASQFYLNNLEQKNERSQNSSDFMYDSDIKVFKSKFFQNIIKMLLKLFRWCY